MARIVGMETVASGYVKSIEAGLAMVMVGGQCLTALANDIKPGEVFVCIRAEEVMLLNAAAASSAQPINRNRVGNLTGRSDDSRGGGLRDIACRPGYPRLWPRAWACGWSADRGVN